VAFLRAIPVVEKEKKNAKGDEQIGFEIITQALRKPTMQIAENSGEHGDVIAAKLLERLDSEKNIGYDANKGEFVDMLKAGIVDPAKVVRTALETAASVAGLMLTTSVLITDLKDDDKDEEPIAGSVR
jgi:chaperonin GroEL